MLEYSKTYNQSGIIALIDFQKAFDSISWDFLYKALTKFNFGTNCISWIKLLYNNSSSCATNNGHASKFFQVERGVRQGCPVSPLLFIVVAEVLACKIRADNTIQGITIGR
jgi:hypothetical protein